MTIEELKNEERVDYFANALVNDIESLFKEKNKNKSLNELFFVENKDYCTNEHEPNASVITVLVEYFKRDSFLELMLKMNNTDCLEECGYGPAYGECENDKNCSVCIRNQK